MNAPLSINVRIVAELRAKLAEAYGLDAEDDAISDTVEGETDLPEQLARIAREALRSEAMAEGMKSLIHDNQNRKSRLEARAEKMRAAIAWAMQEAGFQKLPLDDMTLTFSKGKPALIVDDNVPVPDQFCKITYVPSKTAIRAALEAGEDLVFARLGNAQPTLTIRRG